jgi:ABC-type sugar transport system substrate-binding protein
VITAVFVAEDIVIDPIGLTRMLSITKDHENGKIIFVSWAVVPENCKILKAGVIVATNQSVAESGDGFNADSALRVGTGTTEDGQLRFTYSLKTSKVVYARTYLVYSDENGEMITIYGDVIRTSLAEE